MTQTFFDRLTSSSLDDVYLIGFLDEGESPPRFIPELRRLYLEFGESLLELECIEDTGRLRLCFVEKVHRPVDWDLELRLLVTSLREVHFTDPDAENGLVALRVFGRGGDEDEVTCQALEFELSNGQVLFIDPGYHFGIKVGGGEQRSTWQSGALATEKVQRIVVSRKP